MEERVSVLVAGLLEGLHREELAGTTIKYYTHCCNNISKLCEEHCEGEFNTMTKKDLVMVLEKRLQANEMSAIYFSGHVKMVSLLSEFQRTGVIIWRRRRNEPKPLCPCFEGVLRSFPLSLENELAPGSIDLIETIARQFLESLEVAGHRDFKQVAHDDVRSFIVSAQPRNQAGMGNVIWSLKRLFYYLNGQGYTGFAVGPMLAATAPRRVRSLPCFSREETERIFKAIDISTNIGKRDFAIIKVALQTGLRGCDIRGLQLSDVNWRNDTITVVQQKTKEHLVLPLLPDVGNAIARYILEARPESDDAHVFLSAKRPYKALNGAVFPNTIRRCLDRAGIAHEAYDGKAFHALRRSAGTRLIESGVNLELAAQILGHLKVESSKRYISLDIESLRQCCLPLIGLESSKEGLS